MKHPKTVERKLGREKALGQAWHEHNLIEIDPRQMSQEYLNTAIHEHLHIIFPDWTEKQVNSLANKQSKYLWKIGFRLLRK